MNNWSASLIFLNCVVTVLPRVPKTDKYERRDSSLRMFETLNPFCLFNQEPTEDKLRYILFNRKYPHGVLLNRYTIQSMKRYTKTVIIVQGWLESLKVSPWPLEMKNAYLRNYPHADVINFDWTYYTQTRFLTSSCNTPDVGIFLGIFLAKLIRMGFDAKLFHLIGFSIGGQLVGFAGQEVYRLTGIKLGKITGLDVVGLGFYGRSNDRRLSADDADDVVGIHTDTLLNGIITPFGRVDFYINNGFFQPGCIPNFFIPTTSLIEVIKKFFCSHLAAPTIKIRSLQGQRFEGYSCLVPFSCEDGSWVRLEENVHPHARGSYFVQTDVI